MQSCRPFVAVAQPFVSALVRVHEFVLELTLAAAAAACACCAAVMPHHTHTTPTTSAGRQQSKFKWSLSVEVGPDTAMHRDSLRKQA